MIKKNISFLLLILLHILLGLLLLWFPFLSIGYTYLTFITCLIYILKNQNKNNEALIACAYIVGSEVLIRMTKGILFYEFAKYELILFSVIGILYHSFSKKSISYWIFILLLIPGILLATETLNSTTDIRKTIAFNISGPVSLAIATIYTYNRKVPFSIFNKALLFLGLPIISCAVYVTFYTEKISDVLKNTGSNSDLSGGFGPNQVATIFGLGMFIFFSKIIVDGKNKLTILVYSLVSVFIAYRGLITFSRGGMLTGFLMVLIFIATVFWNSQGQNRLKMVFLTGLFFVLASGVWMYSSLQTGGLINKRYANEDALGRKKSDTFTGREELAKSEMTMFLENPIFGVGVAKGAEIREELYGEHMASHDEITRMLAEHGAFGIAALLILILTPLLYSIQNPNQLYLLSFFIFWLLTINHAAMRTAAPSFIYALALLKIDFNEEDPVHR